MAEPDEEVKIAETIKVDGADNKENETQDDSSASENEEAEPEKKEEAESESQEEAASDSQSTPTTEQSKEVLGETPRERGLRKEVERLKGLVRETRTKGMFGTPEEKLAVNQQLSDEKKKILDKYKPDELKEFEQIFDVLAEQRGFVRKDEYTKSSYDQTANNILSSWLAEHPEYDEDHDKDNVLWNQFKAEVQQYKEPINPRDFKKIFVKVHREIFGVQPEEGLKKIKAQQRKLDVASHAGQQGSPKTPKPLTRSAIDPSMKVHLKGFSDEEMEQILT